MYQIIVLGYFMLYFVFFLIQKNIGLWLFNWLPHPLLSIYCQERTSHIFLQVIYLSEYSIFYKNVYQESFYIKINSINTLTTMHHIFHFISKLSKSFKISYNILKKFKYLLLHFHLTYRIY